MDHLTSGDVMTVMYAVVGVAISSWAMLIGMAMLFSRKAEHAQVVLEDRPWTALILGFVIALPIGLLAGALLANPIGLVKVAGWALLSYLLALSAVGAGGLALLVGRRISTLDERVSTFSALVRGSGLLVLIALVPLFGLFAYMPVVFLLSLGAGVQSLFGSRRQVPNGAKFTGAEL